MNSFVTHLESALDGTRLPAGQVQTLHRDRPLWVRYDLEAVGRSLTKEQLVRRPPSMWRYRELLPPAHEEAIVSLGYHITPALALSGDISYGRNPEFTAETKGLIRLTYNMTFADKGGKK